MVRCATKTVEAYRNGVRVGTIPAERQRGRGRQNANWEDSHVEHTIPAGRGRTPSDGRYCVSGSYSCVQFVNSPITEPDAVEVLVTPRNSFLNGCPSVTYAFRRQVFNGLALICAALSQSGRAGQGMACQERYGLRVWVGRLLGGRGGGGKGAVENGHYHGQM